MFDEKDIHEKNVNLIFGKAQRYYLYKDLKRELSQKEENFCNKFITQLKPLVSSKLGWRTFLEKLMIGQIEKFIYLYNKKHTIFFLGIANCLKKHPDDPFDYLRAEEQDYMFGYEVIVALSRLMHFVNEDLKKDGITSNFAKTQVFDGFLKEKCIKVLYTRLPKNYHIETYEAEHKYDQNNENEF